MRRRYGLIALGAAYLAATGCASTAMRESNDRNAASGSPLWTAGYNGMLATANNDGADGGTKPFRLFNRSKAAPAPAPATDVAADPGARKGLFSWLGKKDQAGPTDVAANDRNARNEAKPASPAGKREVIPVSDVTAVNRGPAQAAAPATAPGGRGASPFARLGARIRGEQAEIPAATVVEQPVTAPAGSGPIRGMVSRWRERQDRRAAEAAAIASLTGPGRMPRSSTAPMQGPMMQPGQAPGGMPINQPWGRPMMARTYRDDSPSFRTTGAGSASELAASETVPPLPVAMEVPVPGSEATGATAALAANPPGRGDAQSRRFDVTPTASRSNQVETERPRRLVRQWRPTPNPEANPDAGTPRVARVENAPIDREAEPTAAPAPAAPAMTQPPIPAPSLPPTSPEPAPAAAPAPAPEPVNPAPAPAPAPEPVKPEPAPAPVVPAQPEEPPTPVVVAPAPAPRPAPAPAPPAVPEIDLGPPPEVGPAPSAPAAPEAKTPEEPKKPEPRAKKTEEPKKPEPAAGPKPKPKTPSPSPAQAAPKPETGPSPVLPQAGPEAEFDLPAIGAPRGPVSMGSPPLSPQLTGPRLPELPDPSLPAAKP